MPPLNKKERAILEQCFIAEINNLLPCQFAKESAALLACDARGWIRHMEKKTPWELGDITTYGWRLTPKGRQAYSAA